MTYRQGITAKVTKNPIDIGNNMLLISGVS